jgi:serine/threonine-protein kinase
MSIKAGENLSSMTSASSRSDGFGADSDSPAPLGADGYGKAEHEAYAKLGETRVVEHPTDAPDMTPPAGTPIPLNEIGAGAVLGDFQVLEKLGEGAMGAVYRAEQKSFDRIVALKILFAHIAKLPHLVERLYREGRVLGHLDHPNILQAYGIGEIGNSHYVAMEFVDGDNLQRWLRRLEKLTVADALYVTLTVARALEYAHAQGIVHRDLKPENILITRKGEVKIADFGMVKAADEDMDLTQTGHALGTPWYMPLEQARNAKEIDGRSDIYALGCMLYCLLVGRPPFCGKTLVDVLAAKETGTFPPARTVNPNVPERLDLVIVKMTAKHPKHRYQNCTELVRDLESLGMAGDRLSFMGRGAKPDPLSPTPVAARTVAEGPSFDPHVWYVRVSTPQGAVVSKYSTEQVQAMIELGKLPPSTPASHFARNDFRAVSVYKEFAGSVAKVNRPVSDKSESKFRSIVQEYESKKEVEPPQPQPSKFSYWLEIALEQLKWPPAAIALVILLVIVVMALMDLAGIFRGSN